MYKYLRVFYRNGTYCGLAMGVFYWIQGDSPELILRKGVTIGLAVGGMITTIYFFSALRLRKKGYTIKDDSARIVERLMIQGQYEEIINVCEKAILSLKSCSVKGIDKNKGTIEGEVGISFSSYGEKINCILTNIDQSKYLVKIQHVPTLFYTPANYGKIFTHVAEIKEYLEKEFSGLTTEIP